MGMSTHVVGFRPPDEKWRKMKAAWEACSDAGISPPPEVEDFFNGAAPDDAGVEVRVERTEAVSPYTCESGSGYEVDLTKLPKGVTILRFYNAW